MKKVIRILLALVMAFQFTGCKSDLVNTRSMDGDFTKLLEIYRYEMEDNTFRSSSESNYKLLKQLETAKHKYIKSIKKIPTLIGQLKNDPISAEKFVADNKDKLIQWKNNVDATGLEMRKTILESSKLAFNLEGNQGKIRAQITALYALLYYREGNRAMINFMTPFMLALGSDTLKDSESVQAFKKEVTDVAFAQVGLSVIINQDLQKVTAGLTELKKSTDSLDSEIQDAVTHTMQSVVRRSNEGDKSVHSLEKQLNQEQQAEMAAMKTQINKMFANKTLLFTPGSNSNVVVDLLSWVGNLTWGLVNSMMGLAIVMTTIIVSPFTEYVDFPTFAFARNGKQIYVDVTGMSPIPGKMSLGFFELDNAAGQDFASGHEGGHAVQSALLGPLYVPVVLFSYAVAGFDQGFMEQWADDWQNL